MTTFDESAALALVQTGDRIAFETLVHNYQHRAYAVAYGFVGNRDDALELAQESFARAYRAIHRFDTSRPFYPWLHRIIRNACMNHLRRRKRHSETSLEGLLETGYEPEAIGRGPEEHAGREEMHHAIRCAMRLLTPEHREILSLRHFQELSYSEIAECLGMPIGTVMSRLHTARRKLREQLESILQGETTCDI